MQRLIPLSDGATQDGEEGGLSILKQEIKMVPLRPKALFNGSVSQQPMIAQHRYGAELHRPTNHESRMLVSSPMPNAFL